MADSASSSRNPTKRGPGRPKGSKNKPDAGKKGNPVGRPPGTTSAKSSLKKKVKVNSTQKIHQRKGAVADSDAGPNNPAPRERLTISSATGAGETLHVVNAPDRDSEGESPITEHQTDSTSSARSADGLGGTAARSKSAGAAPSIQGFSSWFNSTSSGTPDDRTRTASIQRADSIPHAQAVSLGQTVSTEGHGASGIPPTAATLFRKSAPPDLQDRRPGLDVDGDTTNENAAPEITRFSTYDLPLPTAPPGSIFASVTTSAADQETSETCGNFSFDIIDNTEGVGFEADPELDNSRPCPNDDETNETPCSEPQLCQQPHESSHKPFTPRSSIPTWLYSEYKDICEQLRLEMRTAKSRKPACYDAGQFFLNPKNPFFATANQFQVSPTLFYRPQYFIWLPHLFVKIPCPSCKRAGRKRVDGAPPMLYLLGWPRGPRRVVDIEFCIYIFGYRYNCDHEDCKETFQSWSSAILDVLPRPLAAQFTFHLTFRCGLTDRLVTLLRSSFQRGLGPTPFSDMIRNFHIRHYELLQVQYLEMVKLRHNGSSSIFLAKHVRFGSWNDRNGYAGFTPSGPYFRAFYDNFIEAHAREIDQYTAMLPARILAADHSFKVPKHLGKVGGEAVFGALHSVVNEYNEAHAMTLTPTKAHDQFLPVLAEVAHSTRRYGHPDVELLYTDNVRGDKNNYERVFPSLSEKVRPIVPPSSLEALSIPDDWQTTLLSTAFQINSRLNTLMDELRHVPESKSINIAMDMEWSVNRSAGIQGCVAVVSIAFEKCIYIIQLLKFLKHVDNGGLALNPPHALLSLLRSPRILKHGVHIKADFTRLFKDCGFSSDNPPFCGAVELGRLAKDRNISDTANVSLVSLVGSVLRRYLPKDGELQLSTAWDDEELSEKHLQYAALDVYATWAVRGVFADLQSSKDVVLETPAGTPIKLLSRDQSSIVAVGFIAPDRPSKFQGVNITKTRILMNVTRVIQPGYLTRAEVNLSHQEVPIHAISAHLPFTLICLSKDLRIANDVMINQPPQYSSPLPILPFSTLDSPSTQAESSIDPAPLCSDRDESLPPTTFDPDTEQSLEESAVDSTAVLRLQALETRLCSQSFACETYQNPEIVSRVLGDIFHLMNQLKVSPHHGLYRPFSRAFRDALFVLDNEDKANVEAVLAKKDLTINQMILKSPEWVFDRVKRLVPRPDVLHRRVFEVFQTFGPMKDAVTSQPLFSSALYAQAELILENISLGHYSDPPGINLYMERGRDVDGLPLYRCLRGTNSVEGGIHQNIAKRFGSYNASPRFAVNLLRDYCLIHNLKVGTLNRTGKAYEGSFDVWTRNRLSRLIDQTNDAFPPNTTEACIVGWVNGDDFERASETFGILPLSPNLQREYGMHDYSEPFAVGEKMLHCHLAKQQHTRIAVLPVHTSDERALFRLFMKCEGSSRSQPNWMSFTSRWSEHCDGKTIFYKLPEHLKTYYKTWKEFRNQENTIEQHRKAYDRIRALLVPDSSKIPPIAASHGTTLDHEIQKGHLDTSASDNAPITEWEIGLLFGKRSSQQTSIHFKYVDPSTSTQFTSQTGHSAGKGKKRAIEQADSGKTDTSALPKVKRKAPRTCIRCHREDCQGKFMRKPCQFRPAVDSGLGNQS